MHGISTDGGLLKEFPGSSRSAQVKDWLYEHRRWFAVVVLPTLLVSAYFLLFAADQYESEAHFMVRSAETAPQASGLGQALSLVGGVSSAQSEAYSVADYLSSHDAVGALQRRVNLVERFRRPEADILSRLGSANPARENLVRFYRKQVDVKFDSETGIAILKVRAFRAQDSYDIIKNLLILGEQRVNALNIRAYQNTLGVARRQLAEAEDSLGSSQRQLTAYRQGRRDIDPEATGEAQIGMVSQLQARLATARAQEAAMAGAVTENSPQLVALRAQVRAAETQINAASGKLTSGGSSIAAGLGNYQELELRQQFAAKRYDAAAASMQRAREQASRQQLFIVRVVEPNIPQKALYPKSLKIIMTTFFALILIYSIGWLIAAGRREHAT